MNKDSALNLLRLSLGNPEAQFRDNQWEAIDQLVNQHKKLLVVERTGWGKSAVYFISTRILRDQGKGPTIIISPLLALMRNQIVSAQRLGIRADSINSTNREDWDFIKQKILEDQVDALLISPERLANDEFVETLLRPIADRIGMFVVDEAHCISDWGHDFRTDYRRIVSILKFMPDGLPVLATTATANDRVINDIISQLGNIKIIRGPLVRESLILQNIKIKDQAERLAWLAENVPQLEGSGIIYTLTKRDARQVAGYLKGVGINAVAYYSDVDGDDAESSTELRQQLEDSLYNNEIKALVATSALGMGYDKPDLGFVIHYQAPGSLIAYYQQVGRAGRAIDQAYGILLSGQEDQDIHEYFISSAFPEEHKVNLILEALAETEGLSIPELEDRINLTKGQIEQVLKYVSVENPSPVIKSGTKWSRTTVSYHLDKEKIARLSSQKRSDWKEVQNYMESNECLMTYLQNALDDSNPIPCGKCASCLGEPIFSTEPAHYDVINAVSFLKHSEFIIEPRKQIGRNALPVYGWSGRLSKKYQAEAGRVLSRWGDAGWGKMVAEDKHLGYFRQELVDAMAEMVQERWIPDPYPAWISCVPSMRHPELVPDFTRRLAEKLGIPFLQVITKIKETGAQKEQQNGYFQCRNIDGAFQITGEVLEGPVLLVDDAVDSRWTLTITAVLLRQAGSGPVYPVALASTGHS